MKVLYRNKLYELDMPFLLFESQKNLHPRTSVELQEVTSSTYKELVNAELSEVEDYSVARNLQALSN